MKDGFQSFSRHTITTKESVTFRGAKGRPLKVTLSGALQQDDPCLRDKCDLASRETAEAEALDDSSAEPADQPTEILNR